MVFHSFTKILRLTNDRLFLLVLQHFLLLAYQTAFYLFDILCRRKIFWDNTSLCEHLAYCGIIINMFPCDRYFALKVFGLHIDTSHFCSKVFCLYANGRKEISKRTALCIPNLRFIMFVFKRKSA